MNNLEKFIAIAEFLGDDMTDEQSTNLMDQAKQDLSQNDLEILGQNVSGHLYTDLTEYYGECGIVPGYSK